MFGQHRRLKDGAGECVLLAVGDDFGALLGRFGDVCLDLLDRLHFDRWSDAAPGTKPSATSIARPSRRAAR
jgi:hypothetical protein